MTLTYLDFELEIGVGQGLEYPLAVLRSPAGEARTTMRFPFDELQLESRLKDLEIALLRSGGKRRMALTQEEQTVQDFGRSLFDALMSGEVRGLYDVSRREAVRQGQGLRLKLRIASPPLAAVPWEFLYDARRAEYVCLSVNTPLVRYLELSQPPQPLVVTPPLRVLGMIASPSDLLSLDVENEKARVERALSNLKSKGLVELEWLSGQTWRDLQRAMRRGPWHIFHFVGHGAFDANADEGLVILADEQGRAQPLRATELGRLLADHLSLRLAVLNACEGAKGSDRDIFSSTASILVRQGLPAVLAMQYDITDRAAVELSRTLYESLADGLPVDAAVAEARKAVSLALTNSVEWGTPVLYLRSPDGKIFDVAPTSREGQEATASQLEGDPLETPTRKTLSPETDMEGGATSRELADRWGKIRVYGGAFLLVAAVATLALLLTGRIPLPIGPSKPTTIAVAGTAETPLGTASQIAPVSAVISPAAQELPTKTATSTRPAPGVTKRPTQNPDGLEGARETAAAVWLTAQLGGGAMETPEYATQAFTSTQASDAEYVPWNKLVSPAVVVVTGSAPENFGEGGEMRQMDEFFMGLFSSIFLPALRSPDADVDGSGFVSLREAFSTTIASIPEDVLQFPLIAGEDQDVALFSVRSGLENPKPDSREMHPTVVNALLIGIDNYNYERIASLRGPLNDVAVFKQLLEESQYATADRVVVTTLLDEEATEANIRAEIKKLAQDADKSTSILVFYSGHGSRETVKRGSSEIETQVIVPYDFLGSGGFIGVTEIADLLEESEAKHKVLIIDS